MVPEVCFGEGRASECVSAFDVGFLAVSPHRSLTRVAPGLTRGTSTWPAMLLLPLPGRHSAPNVRTPNNSSQAWPSCSTLLSIEEARRGVEQVRDLYCCVCFMPRSCRARDFRRHKKGSLPMCACCDEVILGAGCSWLTLQARWLPMRCGLLCFCVLRAGRCCKVGWPTSSHSPLVTMWLYRPNVQEFAHVSMSPGELSRATFAIATSPPNLNCSCVLQWCAGNAKLGHMVCDRDFIGQGENHTDCTSVFSLSYAKFELNHREVVASIPPSNRCHLGRQPS